jgi:hypothetical protein
MCKEDPTLQERGRRWIETRPCESAGRERDTRHMDKDGYRRRLAHLHAPPSSLAASVTASCHRRVIFISRAPISMHGAAAQYCSVVWQKNRRGPSDDVSLLVYATEEAYLVLWVPHGGDGRVDKEGGDGRGWEASRDGCVLAGVGVVGGGVGLVAGLVVRRCQLGALLRHVSLLPCLLSSRTTSGRRILARIQSQLRIEHEHRPPACNLVAVAHTAQISFCPCPLLHWVAEWPRAVANPWTRCPSPRACSWRSSCKSSPRMRGSRARRRGQVQVHIPCEVSVAKHPRSQEPCFVL